MPVLTLSTKTFFNNCSKVLLVTIERPVHARNFQYFRKKNKTEERTSRWLIIMTAFLKAYTRVEEINDKCFIKYERAAGRAKTLRAHTDEQWSRLMLCSCDLYAAVTCAPPIRSQDLLQDVSAISSVSLAYLLVHLTFNLITWSKDWTRNWGLFSFYLFRKVTFSSSVSEPNVWTKYILQSV